MLRVNSAISATSTGILKQLLRSLLPAARGKLLPKYLGASFYRQNYPMHIYRKNVQLNMVLKNWWLQEKN